MERSVDGRRRSSSHEPVGAFTTSAHKCRGIITYPADLSVMHIATERGGDAIWKGRARAGRAVVVVLDGLRPDAINTFGLRNLMRMKEVGASSLEAATVSPSYTAACLTSLLTGLPPAEHGVDSDRIFFPRSTSRIEPMPRSVARHGYETSAFMGEVPFALRGLARKIGRAFGFQNASFSGNSSAEILRTAIRALCSQRRGLVALHFPDADKAGHQFGWMSAEYAAAAHQLDQTLGLVSSLAHSRADAQTLLVVLADHGGGGSRSNGHVSDHPLDVTIPILLAGKCVQPSDLGPVSLLDIPATVLWALGISAPANYRGRVLSEAFSDLPELSRESA